MMPDYERFKWCGHRTKRGYCHNVADEECTNSAHQHWDDHRNSMAGVLSGTAKPDYVPEGADDHPRFVCSSHAARYGGA